MIIGDVYHTAGTVLYKGYDLCGTRSRPFMRSIMFATDATFPPNCFEQTRTVLLYGVVIIVSFFV